MVFIKSYRAIKISLVSIFIVISCSTICHGPSVTYCNCFEIVSTTLADQTRLRYVYFNTAILVLYLYIIRNGYTGKIFAAPGF